jgi:maltose O-acetyltransferase
MIHFKRVFRMILILLFNRIPDLHAFNGARVFLLRSAGVYVGEHSHISSPFQLEHSLNEDALTGITIGYRTYINSEVRISAKSSQVEIGNRCMIGPRVIIETATHSLTVKDFDVDNEGTRETFRKKIVIRDGAWIGAGAIILGGVTIGKEAIVAAGSVVIKDVEDGTLVGGVPARKIKSLFEQPIPVARLDRV